MEGRRPSEEEPAVAPSRPRTDGVGVDADHRPTQLYEAEHR